MQTDLQVFGLLITALYCARVVCPGDSAVLDAGRAARG